MAETKLYDGSGWVSITDEGHRSASDPHTQYHTDARGDARYKVQNGYEDRTQSAISFTDGTRTFTHTPSGSCYVWSGGVRYTKTTPATKVIANTEGVHLIYYDASGVLQETTTFTHALITDVAMVAYVYWDATNAQSVIFADERHGREMDAQTHLYLHETHGSAWGEGLAANNVVADGSGDSAAHAQIGVDAGAIFDEDLNHDITALTKPAAIPLLYRSGASGAWRKIASTGYICTTAGGGRGAYNQYTGATWQLTEVSQSNFFLSHLIATNDTRTPMFWVVGQNLYTTLALARAGADAEWNSIKTGGLAGLMPEFVVVGTFCLQTANAYANAVKSRIVSQADGSTWVDFRKQTGSGAAGPQGATGATGSTGATGAAGNTVLYGTAAPTTEGVDGNFYIRTTTNYIYGPKASGTWPAGTSLVGPTGNTSAAATPFTPAGTIAASDVQAAIEEVSGDVTALQGKFIAADTTYTVKTSGGDFTTIQDALDALSDVIIDAGAYVTIEIDDGDWAISSALHTYSPYSARIKLKGKTTVGLTSTSIASSSGSSGNYSYVINTGSTTGVSANDYCVIVGSTGGTNPLYLHGCHQITAVAATTVTVNVKAINASKASGNVVCTIWVAKTRITASACSGITCTGNGSGFADIYNLVLVGDAGANYVGLHATSGAYMSAAQNGPLGVANWGYGARAVDGAQFNGGGSYYLGIGGSTYGMMAARNGGIQATRIVCCGAAGSGGHVYQGGYAFFNTTCYFLGNNNGLYAASGGFITVTNASIVTGNTTDFSPTVNTSGNEEGYIDT